MCVVEGLPALEALVMLLPSVDMRVLGQVRALREGLPTLTALVRQSVWILWCSMSNEL